MLMMSSPEIDPETNTVRAVRHFRASGSSTIVTIPPQMMQLLEVDVDDEIEIVGDWEEREITIRPIDDEE